MIPDSVKWLLRDPAVDQYLSDIRERYEALAAGNPLVHTCVATGKSLGLTEAETLMMAVVALGEAWERYHELLVERKQREGTCVTILEVKANA